MKKLLLSVVLILGLLLNGFAQSGLIAQKSDKGLYIEHKVAAGQGLFAIGKLYNVNARYLATYNKWDYNKGLDVNQVIRIPLTDTNFTQKGNEGVPVFYKVAKGEGLSHISSAAKKINIQTIKDWNNLTTDNLDEGQQLVVGFLKSTGMQAQVVSLPQPKEVVKNSSVVEEKVDVKPVEAIKEVVKTQPKTEQPVDEKKEDVNVPATSVKADVVVAGPAVVSEEGFFKTSFDEQVKTTAISKNASVIAGIFKTTSGQKESKYYLLLDKVKPGSIVKLSNPANNKTVYAKVLGEMSGIRLNQGLDIRISDAAATALNIAGPDKFTLQITY